MLLAILAAAAFGVGCANFSIFFSDSAVPGGPWPRIEMAALLSLVTGLVLGYSAPKRWWSLAVLATWGSIVMGLAGVLAGQHLALAVATLPLASALLGTFSGGSLGRRRLSRHRLGEPTR